MTGWVKDLGDRTPCRGEDPASCAHPIDDHRQVIRGVYDAVWCGWCGAIALIGTHA